jgi:hypothetical protein
MSEQGVGRAFSSLLCGLVLGCVGVGCGTSEQAPPEQGEAPPATFAGMRKGPEQVVQRMEPQSGRVAQVSGVAQAGSAQASAVRAHSAPGTAVERQDRERAAEHITPRHLEAELNRLEAELAN